MMPEIRPYAPWMYSVRPQPLGTVALSETTSVEYISRLGLTVRRPLLVLRSSLKIVVIETNGPSLVPSTRQIDLLPH